MSDPNLPAILDRSGDAATVAWAHEGTGNLAALPDPHLAIAAAAALGNVAALQAVTAPKELRKAAAAALHKLKSKGIKIEAVAPPRAFTLAKESFDLPSRAFISSPDVTGDMELLITTSDASGNCALGVVLGATGVKEARHAHLGRGELRDLWKQAEGNKDLAPLPFTSALHYAEQALATSEHKHDWTHFLEHVPGATLHAARILDPLAAAPPATDEEATGPAWFAPPGVLDNGALESGIAAVTGAIAGASDDDGRDAALEELYAHTANLALEDGDRGALARAADLTAMSLTFHGRPKAAAAVRADGEAARAGVPGAEIPGVLLCVKLLLLSQSQSRIGDRIEEIDAKIGADE